METFMIDQSNNNIIKYCLLLSNYAQCQAPTKSLRKVGMGSFPHPMQYFAAAGENYDFVIAVIHFPLNQYL